MEFRVLFRSRDAGGGPRRWSEPRDQRLHDHGHPAGEAAKPRAQVLPANLDPEQRRRTPLGEWLESASRPYRRAPRQLIHEPVGDAELARERGKIGLRREEPIRAPLHDEAVSPLGDDHAAGPPLALEQRHRHARPLELPGGGEPRDASADDGDRRRGRHRHPRSDAARRARSARHAMRRGASFSEAVRPRRMPSRAASARYSTSTSYRISTWSHTKPIGATSASRPPSAASARSASPASGPSQGSGVAPALWKARCQRASARRSTTAATLARNSSG